MADVKPVVSLAASGGGGGAGGAATTATGATLAISKKTFSNHIEAFYQHWKESKRWPEEIDTVAVMRGTPQDDDAELYSKSSALQMWLFGYEFPDTLLVFTSKTLIVVTSKSKAKFMLPLADELDAKRESNSSIPSLKVVIRDKGASDFDHCIAALDIIRSDCNTQSPKIGSLPKETPSGPFANSWIKATDGMVTDVSGSIAYLLSTKDATEQNWMRTSASISSTVLKKHVISDMESVIDEEKTVRHSDFATNIENLLLTRSKDISAKLNPEFVDICYSPIIQSGGKYDLRPSGTSNDDNIHFGTIICALGARYRCYCSNVARTLFVNPNAEQEENYRILLQVHNAAAAALKAGKLCSDPMEAAIAVIKEKKPSLLPHFVKNCGFLLGIEFRESKFVLSTRTQEEIQAGMVFNLCTGFNNLVNADETDPQRKTYAIMIADTVLVTATGNEILTKNDSDFKTVSYTLDEADEIEVVENRNTALASSRLRDREAESLQKFTKEDKRREDQRKLAQKLAEQEQARLATLAAASKGPSGKDPSEINTYGSVDNLPSSITSSYTIHIDMDREAVLLPIYGVLVPFHISVIKNASKDNDYLRVNFIHPGVALPGGGTTSASSAHAPGATFIRELIYRFPDQRALTKTLQDIQKLKKRATTIAKEEAEKKTIKKQEKLILDTSGKQPRLQNVFIRPFLSGRNQLGVLEAHKNGFRFTAKGNTVEILYKNIKHAIFHATVKEIFVLVHFHLKDAIMIGKKKAIDVQFCAEAIEASQRLDNTKRRMTDQDEIQEEQEERERVNRLNKIFDRFVVTVEKTFNMDFERTHEYRDLGFYGVHHRTNVLLLPTLQCLVQLIELPFLVLTLSDVQIAHLERVQFSLRNFDLVFVFKDYNRPVLQITQIPTQYLDTIKEWLNSSEIKYYQGPANLNWNRILATIREDHSSFVEDGGWSFLDDEAGSSEEDEEEEGDEDFDESEFEGDDDDDDEEYDSGSEDDDYEDESGEDEDEDGEDWEELEAKAARADREAKKSHGAYSDEEASDSE